MTTAAVKGLPAILREWAGNYEEGSFDTEAGLMIEAAEAIEKVRAALEFYANPDIYKPHPHGPAFDRRDLSYHAKAALAP